MAIAQQMAMGLQERQTGSKGLPLASFAVEIDLNLDSLPESSPTAMHPAATAVDCGMRR